MQYWTRGSDWLDIIGPNLYWSIVGIFQVKNRDNNCHAVTTTVMYNWIYQLVIIGLPSIYKEDQNSS